jgi:hypothetical protein
MGSDTGTCFDDGMNIWAKGGDESEDGFGIVLDCLIDEDIFLVVDDADLNDFLVVVNSDENW